MYILNHANRKVFKLLVKDFDKPRGCKNKVFFSDLETPFHLLKRKKGKKKKGKAKFKLDSDGRDGSVNVD